MFKGVNFSDFVRREAVDALVRSGIIYNISELDEDDFAPLLQGLARLEELFGDVREEDIPTFTQLVEIFVKVSAICWEMGRVPREDVEYAVGRLHDLPAPNDPNNPDRNLVEETTKTILGLIYTLAEVYL